MFTQIAMRVVELSRYEHPHDSKLHSYSSHASSQMMPHEHTHQGNESISKPTTPNVKLSTPPVNNKKEGWCCW